MVKVGMGATGQLLFATTFLRPLARGGSRAQLLDFNDGVERVVKFSNNPQGLRILPNELVVGRLADCIGVPIPHCGVVVVTESFINAEPALGGFQAGLCFGSEYHRAVDVSGASEISLATNSEQLASIVLLDTWCNNVDRVHNLGNLILTVGIEERMIMAIDHGFCFGRQWDKYIASVGTQVQVICRQDFRQFLTLRQFRSFFERLMGVTMDQLEKTVDEVPREWQVSDSEKNALVTYLYNRREDAVHVIESYFR